MLCVQSDWTDVYLFFLISCLNACQNILVLFSRQDSQRRAALLGRFVNALLNCACLFPSPVFLWPPTALTQTVISILLKKQLLSTGPKLSQESWRTAALIQTKQVRLLPSKQGAGREESPAREAKKKEWSSVLDNKYIISHCSPKKKLLWCDQVVAFYTSRSCIDSFSQQVCFLFEKQHDFFAALTCSFSMKVWLCTPATLSLKNVPKQQLFYHKTVHVSSRIASFKC